MYVPGMTNIGGGAWNRNPGGGGIEIPTFIFTAALLSTGTPMRTSKKIPKKKINAFFTNIEDLLENDLLYPLRHSLHLSLSIIYFIIIHDLHHIPSLRHCTEGQAVQ
jgi:hypothetical protein